MIDIRFRGVQDKSPNSQLSNLANHQFNFDDIRCASVEGVLQSLKFKEQEAQHFVCSLYGFDAKRAGTYADPWQSIQTLWWKGVPFHRSSDEYQSLLDKIYESLYTQNETAKNILLATYPVKLTHTIGHTKISETILTKKEFCSRLMRIRKELYTSNILEF